jgi:hypothetical protein
MAFVAPPVTHYLGTVVGNGHCVAYVREAAGCPHTSMWFAGDLVRGGNYQPGTAIATFDKKTGLYGNHTDGRSHAAILVEEKPDGLMVTDQWKLHAVAQRLIRFKGGKGKPCDDGDQYRVIEA